MTNEEHQLLFTLLAIQECKIVELQQALERQHPKRISAGEKLAVNADLAARYRGLADYFGVKGVELSLDVPLEDKS